MVREGDSRYACFFLVGFLEVVVHDVQDVAAVVLIEQRADNEVRLNVCAYVDELGLIVQVCTRHFRFFDELPVLLRSVEGIRLEVSFILEQFPGGSFDKQQSFVSEPKTSDRLLAKLPTLCLLQVFALHRRNFESA